MSGLPNIIRKIINADIKSSAAIALSKLATGALPSGITVANANVTSDAAIALSKIATGALPSAITVANANVTSDAAIALSKLATGALPSGLTVANANVAADAAIALSKLATGALPSAITVANANVASDAAIALSKLATGAIPTGLTIASANITAGAVAEAALDAALIGNYVDVTIPYADVRTLNTAPYQLVAAPAAGYMLVFDGIRISLDYGAAAYTSVQDATIRYTNGSGQTCATLTGSGFFSATADAVRYLYPVAAAAFTPVAEAAIVLAGETGNMADGDSPLNIRVFYHVVPTGL